MKHINVIITNPNVACNLLLDQLPRIRSIYADTAEKVRVDLLDMDLVSALYRLGFEAKLDSKNNRVMVTDCNLRMGYGLWVLEGLAPVIMSGSIAIRESDQGVVSCAVFVDGRIRFMPDVDRVAVSSGVDDAVD